MIAFLLALLCLLIDPTQAFLPSESGVTAKTHVDITMEALLSVASDACREEAQNEQRDFIPPSLPTPEKVFLACLGVSEAAESVSALTFRDSLNEIINANILVDRDFFSSPEYHFNDEAFERARGLMVQDLIIIRASLQQEKFETARQALGRLTHTLQDFYSHSNWFELGNLDPNPNLLRPDLPFENLADINTPTCNNCGERSCPNIILPEILNTNTLTSGYLSLTPTGKCNHGDQRRAGINKDFSSGEFDPTVIDPHLAAGSIATQATVDLLQNIRIASGNKAFLRMLGITRSAVVCFVVDTTGSMSDEITEVRRLIREIIVNKTGTPDEPSLYILVEFNDPEFGPVTSTTDPAEMIQKADDIRVRGGGDIPELSLSGLQLALTTAPPSSDIFLFTDAPPKDNELLGAVKSLIEITKSRVSFILTNSPLRTRRRRAVSNPSNSLYEQIAQVSGGQAIEVSKATISQATAVIQDSVTSSLVTLLQIDATKSDTFSFLLDPGVQNVTIYITGPSVTFTLQNPSGISQDNTMGLGPLGSVTQVGNLYRVSLNAENQTGTWNITITSSQPYSLRITGRSVLNFMFQFVELFDGPHPGFAPIRARPPAGQNVTVQLTVLGAEMLSDVELGLVSSDGQILRDATVTSLRSGSFLASVVRLPDVPFMFVLRGRKGTELFQRQSTTQIQASQITVQVPGVVVMEPGESLSVPFTVETSGIEGSISIRARDDQRYVTMFSDRLNVDATGSANGSLSLRVPRETLSGSTSVVTIEVESTATRQSNFAVLRVAAIQRVTDFTPPVCLMIKESLDCPDPCDNATFAVTLVMSDGSGTGLQPPRISTTISDQPVNESSTLTINAVQDEDGNNATLLTYSASCCVKDVEISAVDKEGNVGRCIFSIRRPTTTGSPMTTIVPTTNISVSPIMGSTTTTTVSSNTRTSPSSSTRTSTSLYTISLLIALASLF